MLKDFFSNDILIRIYYLPKRKFSMKLHLERKKHPHKNIKKIIFLRIEQKNI